jgi:hypothetical protein
MLGSMLIDTELQAVARQRTDGELFDELTSSKGPLADDISSRRAFDGNYPRPQLTAQLFAVCRELDSRIVGNVVEDLNRVLGDIVTLVASQPKAAITSAAAAVSVYSLISVILPFVTSATRHVTRSMGCPSGSVPRTACSSTNPVAVADRTASA